MINLWFAVIDSVIVLSNVDVVAFRPQVTASQVLERQTIESLSTTTVADALKYFSGVQLKDYGGVGGQKTINVRSMGTQHTGIYIDGIRITNTQNGQVDLSKYSFKNFEKVELYNANKVSPLMSASEYASASTVYFTTKVPDTTDIGITYTCGSFHSHQVSLDLQKRSKVFFSNDYFNTRGDYKFEYHSQYEDTTGYRKNSDVVYYRSEIGWFPLSGFKSHFYFYYTDRGVPGGIVKRLSDRYGDIGREQELNFFGQCSYASSISSISYKFNIRYSYDKLHYNSDYPENAFVHSNNTFTQNDLYSSIALSYAFPKVSVSWSSDYRNSSLDCDVYGLSFIRRHDFKSSLLVNTDNIRLFQFPVKISASGLWTRIIDKSQMAVAEPLSKLTGSVHASLSLNKLGLRTFCKQVFRAPTLNDLYYTNVGKRNLRPELSRQFDAGLWIVSDNLDIQLDWYFNQVWDKIICVPQGGSYNWRMTNRGYVETRGVDLSTRFTQDKFSIYWTTTWQDVRDLSDRSASEYNRQLLYSPSWSHSCILSVFPFKWLNGSVSCMYCGERWWSYASPNDYLAKYLCFDGKLDLAYKRLRVSYECDNILNTYYELIQRWPLPARRHKVTIKIII